MGLSIFLAKLLGIYMLIMALDLLLRKKEVNAAVRDFASSKGLLIFSGSLSLIVGLSVAIGHPVYSYDWRGLITLLGYLMILRGILRVAFPSQLQKCIVSCVRKGYWYVFLIMLIIGLYLTHAGFNATA